MRYQWRVPNELRNGTADAARQIVDEVSGFAIRFVERCQYPQFRWQAGLTETELRDYHAPGWVSPFVGHVTLFRLLGHGATCDEAVQMARENPNRRQR